MGTSSISISSAEGDGTRRFLVLLDSVFKALDRGTLLVVDELDASLHTQAAEAVVRLFLSDDTNRKGAQLIATTHDTNLLAIEGLRRDEIWFTEKDDHGGTFLFPLTEIRTRIGDNPRAGLFARQVWSDSVCPGRCLERFRSVAGRTDGEVVVQGPACRGARHLEASGGDFYLFCEGGNTEPEYFRAVRTSFRNALIELVTHAGVGMPLTIATRASEKAAELKASARDSYEIDDQVWAVFDRDEHPNFADAVEICREQAASLSLVPILVLNFGLSCILRISIGWRIGIKFSEGLGNFAPSAVLMAASWLIQQNSSRRLKTASSDPPRFSDGEWKRECPLAPPRRPWGDLSAAIRLAAAQAAPRRGTGIDRRVRSNPRRSDYNHRVGRQYSLVDHEGIFRAAALLRHRAGTMVGASPAPRQTAPRR